MATTLTGRTRAVSASGQFSGESRIRLYGAGFGGPGMQQPTWGHNFLRVDIQFLGGFLQFYTLPATVSQTTRYMYLAAYTGVGLGNGVSDTDSVSHVFTSGDASTYNWFEDLSAGTWSISYTSMEEILEDSIGGDFPTYGGLKTPDPPYESYALYKDRMTDLGLLTVTATVAGMSVTAQEYMTGARIREFTDYPLQFSIIGESRGEYVTVFGINSTQIQIAGQNAELSGEMIEFDADHDVTAVASDGKVLIGCTATAKKTICTGSFSPLRKTHLNIACRAMEDAYPGSVNLRIGTVRNRLYLLATNGRRR